MSDRIAQKVDAGTFAAWCETVGEDVATRTLERICEAHYSGGESGGGIIFAGRHQHDACNYTLSGSVEVDGISYGFVIDDGNWAGTEVREWGLEEDVATYVPPEPDAPTFIPRAANLGVVGRELYKAWLSADWFKAAVGKLHEAAYDRFVQPGCRRSKDMQAAVDMMSRRGLVEGYVSQIPAWAHEPPLTRAEFDRVYAEERQQREASAAFDADTLADAK